MGWTARRQKVRPHSSSTYLSSVAWGLCKPRTLCTAWAGLLWTSFAAERPSAGEGQEATPERTLPGHGDFDPDDAPNPSRLPEISGGHPPSLWHPPLDLAHRFTPQTDHLLFVMRWGGDCFGLPQGTGLVHAQRMCLLLWVAVSLVGADRLAHARTRTPLPSSCSSSPRFATEPGTQLLHVADPHTAASAAVVVTTARDGCHACARPMIHAAARLTLPGGGGGGGCDGV